MKENNAVNPFRALSELLVDNQNALAAKSQHLRTQIRMLSQRMINVTEQLESDVFDVDLNELASIDIEASKILESAKDLESTRDKIMNSIELLRKANIKKLN